MQHFVKVSNSIFSYNLSPKAIFVYIYLLSRSHCHQAIIKLNTIAHNCNMDIKTVQSALKELSSIEFIRKVNRYNSKGYIANRYYLKNLLKDDKNWFKLPTEVFRTTIKPTDFLIFCYISKCMSTAKSEAFPSLSAIAAGTGVSRGRVSKSVQYLRTYTFINRIKRHYKKTKAYRHNRYMKFKIAKRNACPHKGQANPKNKYSITLERESVNRITAFFYILRFGHKRSDFDAPVPF